MKGASARFSLQLIMLFRECFPTLSFASLAPVKQFNHEQGISLHAIPRERIKLPKTRLPSESALLRALSLIKEEQGVSTDGYNSKSIFENPSVSLNQTMSANYNAKTSLDNIEKTIFNQKLEYELLLGHTKSSETGIQLLEGKSEIYSINAVADEIDLSRSKENLINHVWWARMLVLNSAALYGTNFTVVKILNDYIPTDVGALMRFTLAAGATIPWLFYPSKEKAVGEVEQNDGVNIKTNIFIDSAIVAGLEVGFYNGLGYLAQAEGLETVDASKSAFICSLAVVIVPVLNFLSGKKIFSREILGATIAVIGVGFLELDGATLSSVNDAFNLETGDILSLAQPILFGLGFWRLETAMRRFPQDTKKATAAQLLATFTISLCYLFSPFGDSNELPAVSQVFSWISDPTILGALLWTGLVTTSFTVYLEAIALKTLSAAETTVLFSTEPLFGSAFAAAVMGESLGNGGIVGAALILGGCIFSNLDLDCSRNELK